MAPSTWVRILSVHWESAQTVVLERATGDSRNPDLEDVHQLNADDLPEVEEDQAEGESERDYQRRMRPLRRRKALEVCHELWELAHEDRGRLDCRADYRIVVETGDDDVHHGAFHRPRMPAGDELAANKRAVRDSDPLIAMFVNREERMYDRLMKTIDARMNDADKMLAPIPAILDNLSRLTKGHDELAELRELASLLVEDDERPDWDSALEKAATLLVGMGVAAGKLPPEALGAMGFGPPASDTSPADDGPRVSQQPASPRDALRELVASIDDAQAEALEQALGDELSKDFAGLLSLVNDDDVDGETLREQVRSFGARLMAEPERAAALAGLLTPRQRALIERAAA